MNYGAIWGARLEMVRPLNMALAAVAAIIGAMLVDATLSSMLAAGLATGLITGFGNVLNDVYDRHIDARAHPNRPLPRGALRVNDAASFAVMLGGFGLWEAWVAGGNSLLAFAAINAAVLWLYAAKAKGWSLLGNLMVAYLVASAFLFGAMAGDIAWPAWGNLWAFAATAFLATLAREWIKDVEDAPHDLGRRTLAQQMGPTLLHPARALVLLAWLLSLALALEFGPWWLQQPWQQSSAWVVLPAVGGASLLLGLRGDAPRMQRTMKWAMLATTLSYGAYVATLA